MVSAADNKLGVMASKVASVLAVIMTIACILWNIDAPTRMGVAVLTEQYMALQLGLALCIVFLISGFKRAEPDGVSSPGIIDICLAIIGLGVLLYAAAYYAELLSEQAYRPPILTLIGSVVVILVLEGVRRRSGWALFFIVSVFFTYALFAHKVPGPLIGREMSPVKLVQYVGFDPSAVFSTPLAVGTIIVLLFVFFGQLLFAAGGGAFFTDLAMAATGRTRGGSAKISVIASALFGSISGSAVSNVVTTGVITIPLMRRGGYSKTDAGAIEAIASTGGQLTPPIMGAAAFLMAEFLDISYMTVAAAAVIPAALYYISIFLQVDLIAGRDNITTVDDDLLTVREVLSMGWHFLVPFAVLLGALFWLRRDPADSALMASVAIIVVGFLRNYGEDGLTLTKLLNVFITTGKSMVDLILIVAAAGFVIGILNITGLGFALTLLLVDSIGNNIFLILFVSAFICILLGMGMPTSGVYVLLAALVAPSIVEAGVSPIAAHMFILYFGMMSMITPPIALAAFAAAAITKSNPLDTGLAAMRIGWAAYIIPFIFVCTPALLMNGEWLDIGIAFGKAAFGVFAVSVGIVGFLGKKLNVGLRLVFAILGICSLPIALAPAIWGHVNLICCALLIPLAFHLITSARKSPTNSPAPQGTR